MKNKKLAIANSKKERGIYEMKSKKNAFTLIELLAIIVILAIIAVITVPIILNIIENSRKGAASDSAYGFKDAVNKAYVTKLSEDSDYNIADGTYTVSDLKTQIGLSISGKEPSSTSWVEIEKNNITCLQYDDYKVEFTDGKVSNTEKGECSLNSSAIQYGYKTYDDANSKETSIKIGTSGYTVTGEVVYLKYALTNGIVEDGTVPEACIYSETLGGELCLENNNYAGENGTKQKIIDYFGYDADTWIMSTNNSGKYYNDLNQTLTCEISNTHIGCYNSFVNVDAYSDGEVYTSTRTTFGCDVNYNDVAGCGYYG